MKKTILLACAWLASPAAWSQCATSTSLGSASNLFTQIRNSQNPVAADKNLNMIAFVHRNNAGVFGGNSGNLRYDISVNAGTTWTLDQGVLNPVNSTPARYPNMAIYNPANNTNPANAYVSYMAAIVNGSTWSGLVSGVRQVTGTGNTESYNQPVINPQLIPHSIVKGAPGIFWAVDALFNGASITGYAVYKGTWSSSLNDIVWAHNFSVSPTFLAGPGQDYSIAFDPSGQYGWLSTNAHFSNSLSTAAYYPNLWRTTNGGNTWTGPYTVDLGQFACLSSFISNPNVPSTGFEHDIVVDVNGNPHIITVIANSSNYGLFFGQSHWMYDITMKNGVWAAYPIASVNASGNTWGTGGDFATMYHAPHAARTADGTKVFFTWCDNSNYTLGAANSLPNLFTRAFDVQQEKWTQAKDVTSCNTAIGGKILFPHIAPEVLEPASNAYKIAAVYAELQVANTPSMPASFHFLDNVTYASTEFSLSLPNHSVSIQQGASLLLCPNGTVTLNVTGGAGQALWNTGATTPTISVSSSTNPVYIVSAQKNCIVGSDTISVVNMSLNASVVSGPACPGSTVAVSVTGNAGSYTWMPGGITGSAAVLTASTSPVFTLNASGTGCVAQQTLAFNLLPAPVITIAGEDTVCFGATYNYTAQGGSTYLWSDGSSGNTLMVTANQGTVYTVTGAAANSCTNEASISLFVKPSPTFISSQTHTSVCAGKSATLVAIGFNLSWLWNTGAQTNTLVATPANTSTYEVTGTAANDCSVSHIFTVAVDPVPTLSVTTTRTLLCRGEQARLTVTGATTYTWSKPVATTPTVQVTPTVTTIYTVTGNSKGCVSTFTFQQAVSPCDGITEITAPATLVYPNPTTGTASFSGFSEMTIYDQLGRELYRFSEIEVDKVIRIHFDRPGLYFIKDRSAVNKLIVSD